MALEQIAHIPHPALTSPLVWRQVGAGRPLVLLHGGHGSWAHWARNMHALAHTHTVVSVDMPMYGDSGDLVGGLKGEPALNAMLAVLKDCIEARFGVGSEIDMAGFSFGGMVAAKLHRMLNTRRMVLIGSAGHGGKWRRFVELRKWEVDDPAEREAALRHNIVPFMLEHAESMDEEAYRISTSTPASARATRAGRCHSACRLTQTSRTAPPPPCCSGASTMSLARPPRWARAGWHGCKRASGAKCRTRVTGRNTKTRLG
jgi:pimeloyl-ACP methyl ester carboxylesterase